jgi:hypothetical protein
LMSMMKESMFAPVQLRDLLNQLFGSVTAQEVAEAAKARSEAKGLLDLVDCGMVSFTHFVKLSETPKMKQLMAIFARGAAILCKNCQRGVDIIIPVLLPSLVQDHSNQETTSHVSKKSKADSSLSSLEYRLDEKCLTYMIFQNKNHKNGYDKDEQSASTTQMQPSFTNLDCPEHLYLTLYVQLGGQAQEMKFPKFITSQRKVNDPERYKRVSFSVYGLESFPIFRHPGLFSNQRIQNVHSQELLQETPMANIFKGLAGQPTDLERLFSNSHEKKCVQKICQPTYMIDD